MVWGNMYILHVREKYITKHIKFTNSISLEDLGNREQFKLVTEYFCVSTWLLDVWIFHVVLTLLGQWTTHAHFSRWAPSYVGQRRKESEVHQQKW